jgi:hypothetical protein
MVCRSVARGIARYLGAAAYGEPVSINRTMLRILIQQRVRGVFGGAEAAGRWRESAETALWRAILRRCGARVVIAVQPDAGLCRAGHALGVDVFDLQHGIIDSALHVYYGRERLSGRPLTDLPSGFLTWDDRSADALSVAASRGIPVRVIGNPWMNRFLNPRADDAVVLDAGREQGGEADARGLPQVVITLQHGMETLAPDYIPNGVMADALVSAIADTSDRVWWRIRLHPSQTTGRDAVRVERFLDSAFGRLPNVEWRTSSRLPLPLLLVRASLHVTHFSATTMEAASIGIRTALLDPHLAPGGKRSHLLMDERERGLAVWLPLDAAAIARFVLAEARGQAGAKVDSASPERLDAFLRDVQSRVAVPATCGGMRAAG